MEQSDRSIYRWLSRVVEDGQSQGASCAGLSGGGRCTCPLPPPGGTAHVDATRKAHPFKSLPTELETTDIAPDLPWSRFSKRKRWSPTRDEHPRDQPPATEPGSEYERKPRHKTRKDRYEYKTAGSSNKNTSNADKHKTKRQRRSRKQTMNDGFHASNVARNRLTVRTGLSVLPSFSEPFFTFFSCPIPQSWESSTGAKHRPPSNLAMVSHHMLQVCLMRESLTQFQSFQLPFVRNKPPIAEGSKEHVGIYGRHQSAREAEGGKMCPGIV